ncbi:rhodanese-like domain-containing protein [Simiduia curdlanivorans]|uniref:Rhodanese-like domain-containing protein n=1 Tax=Simiduia curdlanivorans TaxID=1492769 RepID=A0ABV8V733_9GAMM|nr:rhodanese-like domain-containing protein [Simiduia curdlanivorans]MDN3639063.1 rhodanese-like domain-containing protein [Simiduia curdlanivorans]
MIRISAQELAKKVAANEPLCIVDVRTPAEYAAVNLPNSVNFPLGSVTPHAVVAAAGERAQVYLMCRTQRRAEMVHQELAGKLACELVVVDGGIEKMPEQLLVRGKRTAIPLDRQVRIAAGLLVFIGVLGGFFVNPGLFWLSGFVGAGLVFSGVTDTCPMAMAIARMPWNQVRP